MSSPESHIAALDEQHRDDDGQQHGEGGGDPDVRAEHGDVPGHRVEDHAGDPGRDRQLGEVEGDADRGRGPA